MPVSNCYRSVFIQYPKSSIQYPASSIMYSVSSIQKPVCHRCGVEDKAIIKRLRDNIHTLVTDKQWNDVVTVIKRYGITMDEALAKFGYEQAHVTPCPVQPARKGRPSSRQLPAASRQYECQHCAQLLKHQRLQNRKNCKPDNSANGKLF